MCNNMHGETVKKVKSCYILQRMLKVCVTAYLESMLRYSFFLNFGCIFSESVVISRSQKRSGSKKKNFEKQCIKALVSIDVSRPTME